MQDALKSLSTASTTRLRKRNRSHLNRFTRSYIATALWSSNNSDGTPLDSPDLDCELSTTFIRECFVDCALFIARVHERFTPEVAEYIINRESTDLDFLAPHDFWLTRNHHGAGFWDGDWDNCARHDTDKYGELGKLLTTLSQEFLEINLYVADDGEIWKF